MRSYAHRRNATQSEGRSRHTTYQRSSPRQNHEASLVLRSPHAIENHATLQLLQQKHGAANQSPALLTTRFNSYYRRMVIRDNRLWRIADSVKALAAQNPIALTAAKADIVHGGSCTEHSEVAFDYLRVQAKGECIIKAQNKKIDHKFALIGNYEAEPHSDVAVSDPWTTKATPTIWEDHFCHTKNKEVIPHRKMVADGKNVKNVIKAGLTLTEQGKKLAEKKLSLKKTKNEIKKGLGNWIWNQPHTYKKGRDYKYVVSKKSKP